MRRVGLREPWNLEIRRCSQDVVGSTPTALCHRASGRTTEIGPITFSRGTRMSKHETAMTEGFWQSQASGLFFAEYPLVRRSADRATRLVDGLILPDEPHGRGNWRDYLSLAGRKVIVIQTKTGRMGIYLMGQALFSARLALTAGAASVRSILLCHHSDNALLPLLKPFGEVEVWLSDPNYPHICKRALAQ
jgi:hypothetical protein